MLRVWVPLRSLRQCVPNRNGAECREMSLAVAEPEARALLKQMVIAWTDSADQAEYSFQTPKYFLQQPKSRLRPRLSSSLPLGR